MALGYLDDCLSGCECEGFVGPVLAAVPVRPAGPCPECASQRTFEGATVGVFCCHACGCVWRRRV